MQQVVEISQDEQATLKEALRLRGSITRMQEGAKLSRQAIVNLRDLGRAEKKTVEKVRQYLEEKKSMTAV